MLYFLVFYVLKLARYQSAKINEVKYPVSVVICAKNEALNLKKNLPFFLEQDYPDFEVIVVNDSSIDGTADILAVYATQYSNLKVIQITAEQKEGIGKKYPLSVGVENAMHEHLLLSDADCRPCSKNWISGMMNGFTQNIEIVLGFGKYEKRSGWVNKLIQFDTFFVALQYFSFAIKGEPYMGVGRNLAYKKSVYDKVGGFNNHQNIASGDDDLFVMEAANEKNVAIVTNADAHTISISKNTFGDYFNQKKRHLSTGKLYRPDILFHLSVINLSFLYFPLLLWLNILLNNSLLVVLILWMFTLWIRYYTFNFALRKLTSGVNLILSIIFGNTLMLLNLMAASKNLKTKNDRW